MGDRYVLLCPILLILWVYISFFCDQEEDDKKDCKGKGKPKRDERVEGGEGGEEEQEQGEDKIKREGGPERQGERDAEQEEQQEHLRDEPTSHFYPGKCTWLIFTLEKTGIILYRM